MGTYAAFVHFQVMPVYHAKSPENEVGALLFIVSYSQDTLHENIGMHQKKEMKQE